MKVKLVLLLLVGFSSLWGTERKEQQLFAGNIIAYSGTNIETGQFYVQPYLYFTRLNGTYNKDSELVSNVNIHQYAIEWLMSYGLITNVNVQLDLCGYYVYDSGYETCVAGDTDLMLAFQVLTEKRGTCRPNVRFFVGETFPTGKYDNLDVQFDGGDGVGEGAFSTFLTLIVNKNYAGRHPFNWTLNLYYVIPSAVEVEGRNIYFFTPGLRAKVKPGVQFQADFAFEYKFNKTWGWGMDVFFEQQNSAWSNVQFTRTTSIPGYLSSSYTLSLAPSLEYDVNERVNFLVGGWFSVAGRNDYSFRTIVLAFYRQF